MTSGKPALCRERTRGRWRLPAWCRPPAVCCLLSTLGCLFLARCRYDVGQFIAHPTVAQRMKDNLSGELPAPAAPNVNADSFRFAMFGDPQLSIDLKSRLAWFREQLAARGADFFCVLGDLTEHSLPDERAALKAGLDSVGMPYFCTIGNHDLYQADGWSWFKTTFGPTCYALVIAGKVRILFLDSADGTLGADEFAWLERELATDSGPLTIVATHFPVYDGEESLMWRLASPEERYRLLSLLSRHHVNSFVSGHIHGWRHTVINGVNHFICAMPPDGMDYGRPGFLLFTWAHDSLSWEHVEFDGPPSRP